MCRSSATGGFLPGTLDNIEDDDVNRTITSSLQEFLQLTFGWCRSDDLPSLEAIFTLIVESTPAFRRNWYFAEVGLIDHAASNGQSAGATTVPSTAKVAKSPAP